ncbi:putative histidinase kinase-response regulator hybrid protein [Bradyrhizobium sp. ORS 278]|uniref:hybrid sensor histidine kinase/response regulator n=1 Tax=Bradyrhizobium sp. (strain ORS 278) TaxID=114615 RepID=UPI0001508F67|nr:ATP-binding protein [Bradyrhizobium sp. ORS 278]CAL77735.1 putative histidinase kinase-response regulator hybrid protein [Bradyrhizobium sp. ORS 278]
MLQTPSHRMLLVADDAFDPSQVLRRLFAAHQPPIDLCRVLDLGGARDRLAASRYDSVMLSAAAIADQEVDAVSILREMSVAAPLVMIGGEPDSASGVQPLRAGARGLNSQAVVDSGLQFEQLLEVLPDALIVLNARQEVEFVNRAAHRLFGKAQQDFIGERVSFSVTENEVAEIEVYRDKELRCCEVRMTPCKWKSQDAQLLLIHDVTERKRLNEQLRQSQKMEAVGVLAGGIAHDFNNLLLVMMIYAEMIRDEAATDDPRLSDVLEIIRAVDRGRALTQQLLAFSRKQPLRLAVLDLGAVMAETQKMLRRLLPSNIETMAMVEGDCWPVLADRGQIEQVIINLALNARDAMTSGGRLEILVGNRTISRADEAVPPGDYVVMSVIDTGVGISPADLELIFDPFFTTKKRGSGTGLGLSTCYGIINQAGGHISAVSKVGEGTTFTVLLPRAPATTSQEPDQPLPVHAISGQETILLVEDNYQALRATELMLQRAGYAVLTMTNGDEAYRFLQQCDQAIDLVLSDVVMPQLSGPELAQRLAVTHPELPVVFMTGYSNDPILGEAGDHRIGRRRVILKPFKREELLLFVREAIDRKRSAVSA